MGKRIPSGKRGEGLSANRPDDARNASLVARGRYTRELRRAEMADGEPPPPLPPPPDARATLVLWGWFTGVSTCLRQIAVVGLERVAADACASNAASLAKIPLLALPMTVQKALGPASPATWIPMAATLAIRYGNGRVGAELFARAAEATVAGGDDDVDDDDDDFEAVFEFKGK